MPESSLVAARYPTQDDGPYGGEQIQAAVLDLEPFTVPRFETVGARDVAYGAWIQAGNALEDGMTCHTTDDGVRWVRDSGLWLAFDTRWQTYVPQMSTGTPANYIVPGNAVAAGRYFRTGRKVDLEVFFSLGSTTAFSGGNFGTIFLTYPPGLVAALALGLGNWHPVGPCAITNSTARTGMALADPGAGVSTRRLFFVNAAGESLTGVSGAANGFQISSSGNTLRVSATYETAFEA